MPDAHPSRTEWRNNFIDRATQSEIQFLYSDQRITPIGFFEERVVWLKGYFTRNPSYFWAAHRRLQADHKITRVRELIQILSASSIEGKDEILHIVNCHASRLSGILDP